MRLHTSPFSSCGSSSRVSKPDSRKQDAGQRELQFNLLDLTPELQSAVRLDGNV
jgi:hypothetical protein